MIQTLLTKIKKLEKSPSNVLDVEVPLAKIVSSATLIIPSCELIGVHALALPTLELEEKITCMIDTKGVVDDVVDVSISKDDAIGIL